MAEDKGNLVSIDKETIKRASEDLEFLSSIEDIIDEWEEVLVVLDETVALFWDERNRA